MKSNFGIITTKFVLQEVQTAVAGSLTFKFFLENIESGHVKKKRIIVNLPLHINPNNCTIIAIMIITFYL